MTVVKRPGEKYGHEDVEFYIDENLASQLDVVREKVKENDEDYLIAIDGPEGSGKSVFGMQVAKYFDESFCLDRVVFNGKDFQDVVMKAAKGQAIVFDEAFRGLSSRGALSEVNKLLISLMMEIRQRNLFIIVIMPSFFLLDRYVAQFRAKGLFHVYRPKSGEYKGKRGFWMYFNTERKKLLYQWGKKDFSYDKPESSFRGRFFNQYAISEQPYRIKKGEALQSTARITKAETYLDQRNLLLWFINREMKLTTVMMSQQLKNYGWDIAQNTVSESIVKKDEDLKRQGHIL